MAHTSLGSEESGSDGTASTSDGVDKGESTGSPSDPMWGTSGGSTTTATGGDTGYVDDGIGCAPGAEGCPCEDGTCGDGLTCVDDMCTAASVSCESEKHEPNDSEAQAGYMGNMADYADDWFTVKGRVGTTENTSEDWFRYRLNDFANADHRPKANLSSNGELRMCIFVDCDDGGTELKTCNGVTSKSPVGRIGCCVEGDTVTVDYNCGGTLNEDANVYVVVQDAAQACVDYTLRVTG